MTGGPLPTKETSMPRLMRQGFLRHRALALYSALTLALLMSAGLLHLSAQTGPQGEERDPDIQADKRDNKEDQHESASVREGKKIFRYDTFGSEDFWGGKLRLHEAIDGEKHGGVGRDPDIQADKRDNKEDQHESASVRE